MAKQRQLERGFTSSGFRASQTVAQCVGVLLGDWKSSSLRQFAETTRGSSATHRLGFALPLTRESGSHLASKRRPSYTLEFANDQLGYSMS